VESFVPTNQGQQQLTAKKFILSKTSSTLGDYALSAVGLIKAWTLVNSDLSTNNVSRKSSESHDLKKMKNTSLLLQYSFIGKMGIINCYCSLCRMNSFFGIWSRKRY
jgi:hypothetical protein